MHLFVVERSFLKAWVALCSSFGSSLPYAVCHSLFGRAASLWIVPFREGRVNTEGRERGRAQINREEGRRAMSSVRLPFVCACICVLHTVSSELSALPYRRRASC